MSVKRHLEPPVETGKPHSDVGKPALYQLDQRREDVTLTIFNDCMKNRNQFINLSNEIFYNDFF